MQSRYALGRYSAAAVVRRPQYRAPRLTQLLLGEPVALLDRVGKYAAVRLPVTGQEGFVRLDQLTVTDEVNFRRQWVRPQLCLDLTGSLLQDEYVVPLTFGARLPEYDGLQGRFGGRPYVYNGSILDLGTAAITTTNQLMVLVRRWLNVPEAAGGRTPSGIGPVELMQLLYGMCGQHWPPSIHAAQTRGEAIDFTEQCGIGDLAFFDGPAGRLSHLGMVVGNSRVLHVHGCVRLDHLDHYGIYSGERGGYTHKLRVIRRILDWPDMSSVSLVPRYHPAQVPDCQLSIF